MLFLYCRQRLAEAGLKDDVVQVGERLRRGGPCDKACDDFPRDVGVARLGGDGGGFADRGGALPAILVWPAASTNRQQASAFGPIDPAGKERPRIFPGAAWRTGCAAGVPNSSMTVDVSEEQQRVGVPGSAGCRPSR
jgi:hypothetical protein